MCIAFKGNKLLVIRISQTVLGKFLQMSVMILMGMVMMRLKA